MLLADDFIEAARTHPVRERLTDRRALGEEILRGIGFAPWHFFHAIIVRLFGKASCTLIVGRASVPAR
jgi:hypothetical protein